MPGTVRRLRRQLEQSAAPVFSPELLHHSAYARLRARLQTMPVIEQAKGIIMAQSCCDPDEAFDLLRRASQRSNVPVRELAAQIVNRTARSSPGGRHSASQLPAGILPGLAPRWQQVAGSPHSPAASAGWADA